LAKKSIPISYQHYYKMWVRCYLDFCYKYGLSPSHKESLVQFIKKLQEKHQPQLQQKQAGQAVSLYKALFSKDIKVIFNMGQKVSGFYPKRITFLTFQLLNKVWSFCKDDKYSRNIEIGNWAFILSNFQFRIVNDYLLSTRY